MLPSTRAFALAALGIVGVQAGCARGEADLAPGDAVRMELDLR